MNLSQIKNAVKLLQTGELVAFPTETVYGLGADANNAQAVSRIFTIKGRPLNHPVIVHLANAAQITDWASDIPPVIWQLAKHFWPGPVTVILRKHPRVSTTVTGGQDTIGLRIPAHPVAQALLSAFDSGIAAPSANRFGRISPTQAAHVQQELGNRVAMVLDGGPCEIGIESTIIDASTDMLRILRLGAITAGDIQRAIGKTIVINHLPTKSTTDTVPRVSGRLISHYAPEAAVKLIHTAHLAIMLAELLAKKQTIGVISRQTQPYDHANLIWIKMPSQPDMFAQQIYQQLRYLDELRPQLILIETVPNEESWFAIGDRLEKAAGVAILK